MAFLHDDGLSQAVIDLLEQLVKYYRKNNYMYNEALNYISGQMITELAREDHDVSRHRNEILERARIEITYLRKKRVPNLTEKDIQDIIEQLEKKIVV